MKDENPIQHQVTKEPQYARALDLAREGIVTTLGLMTNQAWADDPKHLLFTLARYKFVAKMLSGRKHVLELGCADAFGTRLVLQEVQRLTASDFDPMFVFAEMPGFSVAEIEINEDGAGHCINHPCRKFY